MLSYCTDPPRRVSVLEMETRIFGAEPPSEEDAPDVSDPILWHTACLLADPTRIAHRNKNFEKVKGVIAYQDFLWGVLWYEIENGCYLTTNALPSKAFVEAVIDFNEQTSLQNTGDLTVDALAWITVFDTHKGELDQ